MQATAPHFARQGGRDDTAVRADWARPTTLEELHARWFGTFLTLRARRDRDGERWPVLAQFEVGLVESFLEDIAGVLGKAICGRCERHSRTACTHLVQNTP